MTWRTRELQKIIHSSKVDLVGQRYFMLQMKPNEPPPADAFAVIRDRTELSVVLDSLAVERSGRSIHGTGVAGPFGLIRVRVAAPFVAVGFIALIADLIAREGMNVLVLSTFSYDYLLIREGDLCKAYSSLLRNGFPEGAAEDASD